ncbi:MAG: YabP/YqfC family sporulation protein [Clostridia bacterium]|nr:YabP/YqfC family sporulation protein [Clostridia bacterium]
MGDIIHQSYHILIENGKKTLVSGCRKILEYSPERIKIQLHREIITLLGSDLTLYDFFGDEIQISGKVGSLEISSGENIDKRQERSL